VRGERPGLPVLTVTYRDRRGRTASASTNIVVARVTFATLRDPAGVPVAAPALNELDRPLTMATRQNGVASRTVEARFEPAATFAGRRARWTFTAAANVRGALPAAHRTNLEAAGGFDLDAAGTTRIDASGNAAVRVNMPIVSFNRATLAVTAVDRSTVSASAEFEVPGIVVIDAGHGGNAVVGGSSPNNAVSPTGVREKDVTLDMARRVRTALQAVNNHIIRVHMTRDADVNVGINARAHVARDNGADLLLSIHMNGVTNAAVRGTVAIVRANANGNVNRVEDAAFARRMVDASLGAITNSNDRGVADDTATPHGSLGILNDNNLGNTAAFHPIRSCLLEVEFLTNAAVDVFFNTDANQAANRQGVANAVANAIVDDLSNQP
jgi:N-acetylmuramoyl-L-alanine amidase